jgi:chromosome segregation ATPase
VAAAGAAKTAAAAVTRLVEQARSQEAAEGRRAASLEATLHEVKIELAEERNKRALTEAAESLGREKISVLEADAQEAAAVRLTATAARDVMTGHRRSLEEALGASKQALSASTHENGQLRNAADADANAAAMLKATADTLLDRAEWAEGEVKRLTRAAVTERDETMDVKRQVADLTRAMSTSSTKQENVLAETSRLECEVLLLTFQLEQLRSKLQDTEAGGQGGWPLARRDQAPAPNPTHSQRSKPPP